MDAVEMQFERDHLVEMRRQTNFLEEQTQIMRSMLNETILGYMNYMFVNNCLFFLKKFSY